MVRVGKEEVTLGKSYPKDGAKGEKQEGSEAGRQEGPSFHLLGPGLEEGWQWVKGVSEGML